MQTQHTQISCPNCDHPVDVNDILYRKLDADLRKKYEDQLATDRNTLATQKKTLEAQQVELQQKQAAVARQIEEGIQNQIASEREKIARIERGKAQKESEASTELMQKELNEKTEKLQDLHKTRAEVSRLQREKETLKVELEAENQEKLNQQLKQERERIKAEEAGKTEMKFKEIETQNKQLSAKLKDAQQKIEQGSMQIQGEAQELAVEEWLRHQYPLDDIQEIKKGAQGGDCIQIVNTHNKIECGKIYYESKQTKAFQPAWIEKFKADIRDANADIGVLVSQARPAGYDRMALIDGVWVCNFEEFKGLCIALRIQITEIDRVATSQENRGEKINMLWTFLQSNEFRLQVEGIVEGFNTLKSDLEKEKRATLARWKKTEKQIDKVILNTTGMYGSIRGIAGTSIQTVAALELEKAD